jgi:LuxR family maltose regulon positive regulatory protein
MSHGAVWSPTTPRDVLYALPPGATSPARSGYPEEKFLPPVVTNVVQRPRLIALAAAEPAAPVTVLAATAGWGKTLFAASWLAEGARGPQGVWVGLDQADDDPHAFWSALATALAPVVGPGAGEALRKVVAGAAGADDLPRLIVGALRQAQAPIALVLDNLHEITSPQVHGGLVRLIQRPPPNLSLLVTTRREPPWPLARLRMAGLVRQMAAADLAFRADEAAQLFSQLGVGATGPQLDRLIERTEGWPAGLRLAALHLKDVDDPDAAIETFSGQDHSVASYLLAEVLEQQSRATINFLKTISVVDLVCADLADAITGSDDGAATLADLAASHLFVQAVGQPGHWYRLHRLLSDVLRAPPAPRRHRRELQRRAAEWYRRNNMPLEALHSAVAGQLWPLAANLAGTYAFKLIMVGRARSVERTMARIPRTALGVHPELAGALALARIALGSDAAAATLIDLGRSGSATVSAERATRASVLLEMSASGLARLAGDWTATLAAGRSVPTEPAALAALRMAGSEILPVVVANNCGIAALLTGDLPAAERYLTAAADVELADVAISQLNAKSYHALLQCERGELDLAETEARAVIHTATATGLGLAVQSVAAYLTMARLALDRGDTTEADEWLQRIADVEAVSPEPHIQMAAAIVLANRREAAGDREAALTGLRAQRPPVDWQPPPALRERFMLTEATLYARAKAHDAALGRLEQMGQATTDEGKLTAARVHLLLGDLPTATAIRADVTPPDHVRGHVTTAVLDTLLATAADHEDRASAHLENALVAAARCALRRPFLTDAPLLQPLIKRRVDAGTAVPAFALDLMERIAHAVPDTEARRAHVDPLTERERTVLRYLASTLSIAEIARELYVSVNTVKTHQRSIYHKLDASGRRDAVHRARLLDRL